MTTYNSIHFYFIHQKADERGCAETILTTFSYASPLKSFFSTHSSTTLVKSIKDLISFEPLRTATRMSRRKNSSYNLWMKIRLYNKRLYGNKIDKINTVGR